jgi:iron complex transport system substrate-binding protein
VRIRKRIAAGLFGLLFLAVAGAPGAAAAGPRRIVSTNLCTDELLLALADPGEIAALSPYSVDPDLSVSADAARRFRHDAGSAEIVAALDPDLVLGSRYDGPAIREMVRRLGYPLEEFEVARSIADSVAQIRAVAGLVGHPGRGEAMVASIEAARARALALPRPAAAPTAVVYERRGFVSGGATLTRELLALVGIDDRSAAIAGGPGGFVPLERIVALRPDYLVVTAPSLGAVDQGAALLAHPALSALYPPGRRIVLPEAMTVCGGASLAAAIDRLATEAGRLGIASATE